MSATTTATRETTNNKNETKIEEEEEAKGKQKQREQETASISKTNHRRTASERASKWKLNQCVSASMQNENGDVVI